MKTVDREYVEANKGEIVEAMKVGKIFIYPTDTIYGLGCNALLPDAVSKIREIKNRDNKPFSVIVPSKDWIEENCFIERSDIDKYLPGPYTLIVKLKSSDGTLGVRIPNNWFTEIIEEAGIPFITTSVNISGEKHMENLEDLNPNILNAVDYIVYEGEKKGERSDKINLLK